MLLKLAAYRDRLLGRNRQTPGVPPPFDAFGEGTLKRASSLEKLEEWTAFEEILDGLVMFQNEQLLATSSTDQLHFLRGFIAGLRKAALLPTELTQILKNLDASGNQPKSNAAANARLAATYATPAYKR